MIMRRLILFFFLFAIYLYGDNVLVIYDDFAVVNENIMVKLKKGNNDFSLYDLPKTLYPESFSLIPIKNVVFTNIQFSSFVDNTKFDSLVTVYVGEKKFRGKLMSKEPLSILTSSGNIISFGKYDRMEFKNYKTDIKHNVFNVEYVSKISKEAKIAYRFEVRNISWEALYDFVICDESKSKSVVFDLTCKVKVINNSGKNYKNYFVKLFSGNINNGESSPYYRLSKSVMAAPDMGENEFSRHNISEYYIYNLKKKVDILDNKVNFFNFLNVSNIKGEKVFFYEPYKNNKKIFVRYIIENRKNNSLGIALPSGTVELFKRKNGIDIQIGKDRMGHIPKDEKIELCSGFAYDITAKKVLLNKKKVDRNTYQYDYEVTIFNHKTNKISVNIKEQFSGQVFVKSSNYKFKKLSNNIYLCVVDIKPDSFEKVTYTVVQTY